MDSWGKFIENYLVNNVHGETTIYGACQHGALLGADGNVWAATEGFSLNKNGSCEVAKEDGSKEKISINEFDHIVDALVNRGDAKKMKRGGVHFLGHKWVGLDGFEGKGYYTLYFRRDGGGAAVTRTDKGNLVIGTWNGSAKAVTVKKGQQKEVKQSVGFCNNAVDDLSKVLVSSGL